jgi:hypothetical protein
MVGLYPDGIVMFTALFRRIWRSKNQQASDSAKTRSSCWFSRQDENVSLRLRVIRAVKFVSSLVSVAPIQSRFAVDEVEGDGFDAACRQRAGELWARIREMPASPRAAAG